MDAINFNADEEQPWIDPEWAAALEESTQKMLDADPITVAAIQRDEKRALAGLKKMAPSHMKAVLLSKKPSGMHCRTIAGGQYKMILTFPWEVLVERQCADGSGTCLTQVLQPFRIKGLIV